MEEVEYLIWYVEAVPELPSSPGAVQVKLHALVVHELTERLLTAEGAVVSPVDPGPGHPASLAIIHQKALAFMLQFREYEWGQSATGAQSSSLG